MADPKFSLTPEEAEELRKLPPNRRLQRLKEIEEEKRAALEEAEKATEESISLAEDLLKEAEDELATEEEEEDAKEERKKDGLEGLVGDAPSHRGEKQYGDTLEYSTKPFGEQEEVLYRTLKGTEQELERLAEKDDWNSRDVRIYQQAKEQVARIGEYQLTNDSLMSELGLANDALHRLQYKR